MNSFLLKSVKYKLLVLSIFIATSLQSKVVEIANDGENSYFLFEDSSVWALGNEWETLTKIVDNDVVSISAGGHLVFIKKDGSLWGMGSNYYGQLGQGYVSANPTSTPVEIVSGGILQAEAGGGRTLFLKSDGSLWAVGESVNWFLNSGSRQNISTPIQIANNVKSFSSGSKHVLYLSNDNMLYSRGTDNGYGQLGNGSRYFEINYAYPLMGSVISYSAYNSNSAFVADNGSLYVFGSNTRGQIGNGGIGDKKVSPYKLIDSGVTEVFAGGMRFKKADGSLWGMGDNRYGQVGVDQGETIWEPVKISDINFVDVRSGNHVLHLQDDGTVWGTGNHVYGGLGNEYISGNLLQKIVEPSDATNSDIQNDENKFNKQWGWFHWPWVYINSEKDWVYFWQSSTSYLVFSNNKKSWYKWDSSLSQWVVAE